jgi:hypothetical protein
MRRLSEELNREDSQLRSWLLDAALAGLRVTRNPESPELSGVMLSNYGRLSSQSYLTTSTQRTTNYCLGWRGKAVSLRTRAEGVHAYHYRLRTLIGATDSGDERLTDAQARRVGRALSGLAVNLDDSIAS